MFTFYFGLRGNFSTDYNAYVRWFDLTKSFSFHDIIYESAISTDAKGEFLLFVVFKIIHFFSDDPIFMETVCGALYILPVFFYIKKHTNIHEYLSLLIFFCFFFPGAFNVMRSYIAFTYVLLGIDYAFEKKIIKWSLCIAFCSIIHLSALFIFPLYFILYKQEKTKKRVLVLLSILGFFIFFDKIVNFIAFNSRFYDYFSSESAFVSSMKLGTQWIPPALMWVAVIFFSTNNKTESEENKDFQYCSFLAISMNILQYQVPLMMRYASFMNLILIIAFPTTINNWNVKVDTKTKTLLGFIAILLIYSTVVCPIYRFYWE